MTTKARPSSASEAKVIKAVRPVEVSEELLENSYGKERNLVSWVWRG